MDPTEASKRIQKKPTPRLLCLVRELAAGANGKRSSAMFPVNGWCATRCCWTLPPVPQNTPQLAQTRNLPKGYIGGQTALSLLEAVRAGKEVPCEQRSKSSLQKNVPKGTGRIVDLLRVLLKVRSEEHNVASKLIANTDDLENLPLMMRRTFRP